MDAQLPAITRTAWIVGIGGVLIVSVVLAVLPFDVPAEVAALLLLLPITLSSVLSSWRVGLPVAVLAGVAHALLFIPPVGVISLGYTQDVVTLLTFAGVAGITSVLVTRRSIANRAELIGRERMLLLRSVSHDIRSPLNVILAASTELLDGADHTPEMRRRLLGLVVEEAERLDRIVDNLLNLGRLQAGALAPTPERVPVSELFALCEARFDRVGRSSDELTVVPPDPDVDVSVDPVQIDQVLTNLVENAVRHGTPPTHIEIRAIASDSDVRVFVDDDGPGFSQVAREQLFAPFASTDGSSGLGLTVCKAIVEAHGGSIAVLDSAGGGTSVSFTVPRAR